ncbi:MAG: hypothetical protein U0526_04135 [Candidatus Saccharibacteria bacterium]
MRAPNSPQQKFFFSLLGAAALLLITPTLYHRLVDDDPASASPTTTTTAAPAPAGTCGSSPWFYARDTEGNQFGPAAPEEVNAAQAEFTKRRCVDPALLVADSEYLFNEFSDPTARVAKTQDFIANPDHWALSELRFQQKLGTATKVEVATMSGGYQTMDMVDRDRSIPEIYQIPVEAAPFRVLRYTFPDGSVKNFKLNCGFQPVEQSFPPSVPGKGAPPAPNQPAGPVTPSRPGGHRPPTPPVGPTVPPTPGKCANQQGQYCGTPDSGPEFDPVQSNPQSPTPGYVPGNAETVINQQQNDAAITAGGGDPYRPTQYGTPGTGTGSGVTTPSGQTSGPTGNTTGGTVGASNPDNNTNTAGQTSSGTVAPPP